MALLVGGPGGPWPSKILGFFFFIFKRSARFIYFILLPACCAPHAGLGIEKFFFTICQENFMKKLLGKFHGKFVFTACCAPHAGLGIEKFFFTICQENFMKKLLGKFHGKFIFMTSHFQK